MKKEQTQVSINDEVGAVRALSAVFITFTILIISSYSDMPQSNAVQNTSNHPLTSTHNQGAPIPNQTVNIAFNVSPKIQTLIPPK